jgi:hypothetical protein
MVNDQLAKYPQWRYTNVKSGDKRPYPDAWQNTPLTLEQVASTNIGLILGEHSGGVMAIDFDGETAWQWFDREIGCPLPPTASWTSGKPYRCQMAFTVPPEAWELLRPKKIVTKPPSAPGAGDGEGFEFRWRGNQSVLPPSVLNDGRRYEWIDTSPVAEIPYELLEKWVVLINTHSTVQNKPYTPVEPDDLTEDKYEDIREILTELKRHYPSLGYEDWFRVICITANELGDQIAEVVLQELWPETRRGEYRQKMRSRNPNRTGGVGGLVYMVRQHNPNFRRSKLSTLLNDTTSLDKINQLLGKK